MLKTNEAGRGFAALSVTAYHLSIGLGDERYLGHRVFETFTWRLNLGVDFFFVLSGFIITMSHAADTGRPDRLGNFARKRFIRIYPIYWFYLTAFLVLVGLGIGRMPQLPDSLPEWLTSYSLVRFETFQTPIAPAWTLFHEIIFYAVFALLILNRNVGLWAFVVWAMSCAALSFFVAFPKFSLGRTVFDIINLDFAIGMLAFLCMHRLRRTASSVTFLIAGCLLLAGTYLFNLQSPENRHIAIAYGLSFGLILMSVAALESNRGLQVPTVLVFLGDASYSIYLVHEAFEGLFMKIFVRLEDLLHFGEAMIYFGVLTFSIASGCIAHLIFEKPLLTVIRKYTRREECSPEQRPARQNAI